MRSFMRSLGVAIVVVAGCSGGAVPGRSTAVAEADWTDGPWPLVVSSGQLSCEGTSTRPMAWFQSPDGQIWPLNGTAMGEAQRRGGVYQPAVEPIHGVDEAMMAELRAAGASEDGPVMRISVGALLERALELCE